MAAVRSPVCIAVRYSVHATCRYTLFPAARAIVSSACATGAEAINSRTRGRNTASNSRAARPREATNPADTSAPSRVLSTLAARRTGRWCAHTSHAARAASFGPYWARPRAHAGTSPTVVVPQPVQVFATIRCSVTYGRGGADGASNTWCGRSSNTSASARSAPQPQQAAGSWHTVSSGSSTSRSVLPGAPSCLPRRLPEDVREDRFGAGLANGGSDDGGLDEFEESLPNRRSNSSNRTANRSHWELNCTTRPVNWVIVASFATSRSFSSSFDGSFPDSTARSLSILGSTDRPAHQSC